MGVYSQIRSHNILYAPDDSVSTALYKVVRVRSVFFDRAILPPHFPQSSV